MAGCGKASGLPTNPAVRCGHGRRCALPRRRGAAGTYRSGAESAFSGTNEEPHTPPDAVRDVQLVPRLERVSEQPVPPTRSVAGLLRWYGRLPRQRDSRSARTPGLDERAEQVRAKAA